MQKIIAQRSVEIILAVILVVFFLVNSIPADENYKLVTEWGGEGSGNGQFDDPKGIAIDSEDNIYVTDTGNNCIQKFTSEGKFITKWGSEGAGDGEFNNPEDVAIDREGNVYVADRKNYRIQKFTSEGEFITKWGSEGTGDGEFCYPRCVDTDSEGNVYVADTLIGIEGYLVSSRIQKFTSEGEFTRQWGCSICSLFEADFLAFGLATDNEDKVYVLDIFITNSQIQVFNSDGELITKWIFFISGDVFVFPSAIATDSEKNVYLAGGDEGNIAKFTSDGKLITLWKAVPVKGKFGLPPFLWGVAIDSKGDVYVTVEIDNIVQKYAKTTDPCVSEVALQGNSSQLQLLRDFRNGVLSNTQRGKGYINLYYQHSTELSSLMLSDERLRTRTAKLITDLLPAIESLLRDENAVISKKLTVRIESLLDEIGSKAIPELRTEIGKVKKEVKKGNFFKLEIRD